MEPGRITKQLTALLLVFTLSTFSVQAQILSGVLNVRPAASVCAPPAFTYDWAAWNPANICLAGAGDSCAAGGLPINYIVDSIGGNTAAQSGPNTPTYYTSQVNGLGAATFAGAQFWTLATSIPASNNFTFWAVLKITTGGAVFGPTAVSGMYWNITPAAQQLIYYNSGVFATAVSTYSTSAWYTLAATYNTTSGAYAFYNCSGGACTSIGSGTSLVNLGGAPITHIGAGSSAGQFFNGQMAEMGYYNGISTAGIGAWSLCKYGI